MSEPVHGVLAGALQRVAKHYSAEVTAYHDMAAHKFCIYMSGTGTVQLSDEVLLGIGMDPAFDTLMLFVSTHVDLGVFPFDTFVDCGA